MQEPIRLSYVFDDTDTSEDAYLPDRILGRFAHAIKVKAPDFTNAITLTINVYDSNGDLLFTKAAIAENAVTMVYPQVVESKPCPLVRKARVNITLSGAAGGSGGTVLIAIFPV